MANTNNFITAILVIFGQKKIPSANGKSANCKYMITVYIASSLRIDKLPDFIFCPPVEGYYYLEWQGSS